MYVSTHWLLSLTGCSSVCLNTLVAIVNRYHVSPLPGCHVSLPMKPQARLPHMNFLIEPQGCHVSLFLEPQGYHVSLLNQCVEFTHVNSFTFYEIKNMWKNFMKEILWNLSRCSHYNLVLIVKYEGVRLLKLKKSKHFNVIIVPSAKRRGWPSM